MYAVGKGARVTVSATKRAVRRSEPLPAHGQALKQAGQQKGVHGVVKACMLLHLRQRSRCRQAQTTGQVLLSLHYVAEPTAPMQHQAGFGQAGAQLAKIFNSPGWFSAPRTALHGGKISLSATPVHAQQGRGAAESRAAKRAVSMPLGSTVERLCQTASPRPSGWAKRSVQACVEAAAHPACPASPAGSAHQSGVVAVAHPHRDARPACHGVVKHASRCNGRECALRVGGEQLAQFTQIAGQVIVCWSFVDTAA